jgi:hypothetical protein
MSESCPDTTNAVSVPMNNNVVVPNVGNNAVATVIDCNGINGCNAVLFFITNPTAPGVIRSNRNAITSIVAVHVQPQNPERDRDINAAIVVATGQPGRIRAIFAACSAESFPGAGDSELPHVAAALHGSAALVGVPRTLVEYEYDPTNVFAFGFPTRERRHPVSTGAPVLRPRAPRRTYVGM